jgi:predicted NBD/HSP70 family sugar kinase
MLKKKRVQSSNTTRDMRIANRHLVLTHVRDHSPVTRIDLSKMTGLTEPSLSRISRELLGVGLLMETDSSKQNSRVGRPSVGLRLGDEGAFVLGFDISANSQSVCLVNLRGDVLEGRGLQLDFSAPPAQTLRMAAATANQMVMASKIVRSRLLGAGVAIAGVVDAANEKLMTAPNLGWSDVAVAAILSKEISTPVHVENRTRALLMAESRVGAARGKKNVALFQPSLGIGGALMLDGRLIRGSRNAAAQIGHLPAAAGKELCSCGRHGCLDTVGSGHAILTRLGLIKKRRQMTGHGPSDARLLREAIEMTNRDAKAARAFRTAGYCLGTALKQVAVLLDPEIIILGGTVLPATSYFEGVKEAFANYNEVPLVISRISEEAVASELALDIFVFSGSLAFDHLRNCAGK